MKELAKIGKNAAWQLFGKGIGTILSMATIFLIIRFLGPENYGTFALLGVIMNLFYMFGGLGTENSMAYFLQKFKSSQMDLIKKFLKARGALIVLSSIILFFSINYIADFYNNPDLKNYLPIIVFTMPFFILMDVAPLILQGLNNFKTISISDLIFNAAKLSAIPLVIYFGVYGAIIGYFVAYLAYVLYAFKKIFQISKASNKKFSDYFGFAKFSLINYAGTIAFFLGNNLLQLFLGKTPIELGYLDASMRVGMLMTLVSTALFSSLVPNIVNKKLEDMKKISKKIMNYIFIYAIPLLCFFVLSSGFAIRILLGSDYLGIEPIIQIAAIISFIDIFSGLLSSISYSSGKNKYVSISYVIKLAIILIFSSYAFSALNVSLVLLLSSFAVFGFYAIKMRKHYSIDFLAIMKVIIFSAPLIAIFIFDKINIYLRLILGMIFAAGYAFLAWKKILDDVDRDLFKRFAIKMRMIILKK